MVESLLIVRHINNNQNPSVVKMHLAVAALLSIFGALLDIAGAQRRLPVTTTSTPSSNLAQYQYTRCSQASAIIAQASTTISNRPKHILDAYQSSSSANFAPGRL